MITAGNWWAPAKSGGWGIDGWTCVILDYPCNGDGALKTVKISFNPYNPIAGVKIGTVYGNPYSYKSRDYESFDEVEGGEGVEITGLNIEARIGDLMAYYAEAGYYYYGGGTNCGVPCYNGNGFDGSYHDYINYGYDNPLSAIGSAGGSKAFMHHYRHLMAGGVGRQC